MKRIGKKLIAIAIIFSMLFLEGLPIFNNISIAADNPENNVEVNISLYNKNTENATSITADVDDDTLVIKFKVNIKDKGYLRSGTFKLSDSLNFTIKEDSDIDIQNNQIKLPDIDNNERLEFDIPIEFQRNDTYQPNYLDKTNLFIFSGIYVDNDGESHAIEREFNLHITWEEETSTKIETEITKNIDYEQEGNTQKILQTRVKISGNKENKLPIKNSQVKIELPKLSGMTLNDVKIEADKLAYTQGREDYDIELTDVNYDITDNLVTIHVGNNEKDEIIYNSQDEDIYIITCIYNGTFKNQETQVSSNIEATINNYAKKTETIQTNVNYDLTQKIGNFVNYSRENKNKQISKGYLMAKSEKNNLEYTQKDTLNINKIESIDKIEIIDKDEYFETYDSQNAYKVETTYKSTTFSRDNLVDILGEDGNIQILNLNNEIIANITFDKQADQNGKYIINYESSIPKIKIRTSSSKTDGSIYIVNRKTIENVNFNKETIQQVSKLVTTAEAYVTSENQETKSLGESKTEITLMPTKTSANIEMEKTELSAIVNNENVNFKIYLNNNEDTSDMYENPIFEIHMPKSIKNVNLKNVDLFYSNNEFTIIENEVLKNEENTIIRIALKGNQTLYNFSKVTNGTVISLDADLTVEESPENISEQIEMYYYNEKATTYENETEWRMLAGIGGATNGNSSISISYVIPEEDAEYSSEPEEQKEDQQENLQRVSAVRQSANAELLEEGVEAKFATMYITIANNTTQIYHDFRILGRIPFVGNKDIQTGEDLGTTVDTILDTEITSEDIEHYTVYYSTNGEATDDLDNPDNAWTTNYYKAGAVKSYLIIVDDDYILEPGTRMEFSYDYVIPANLKSNDAFYGTYITYYKETTLEELKRRITKTPELNTSIEVIDGSTKEFSDIEYGVSLLNEGNQVAQNVSITFTIPDTLTFKEVIGENITKQIKENTMILNIPNIPENKEYYFVLRFRVNRKTEEMKTVKLDLAISGDNIEQIIISAPEEEIIENRFKIQDNVNQKPMKVGINYYDYFLITNADTETYYDVKVVKKFSKPIKIVSAEQLMEQKVEEQIDYEKGEITWIIPEFKPRDSLSLRYTYASEKPDNNEAVNEAEISSYIDFGNVAPPIYTAQKVSIYQPLITLERANSADVGYAKAGDVLNYEYKITNNGVYDLKSYQLKISVSDNSKINYIETIVEGQNRKVFTNSTSKTITSVFVPAKTSMYVIVNTSINKNETGYAKNNVDLEIDGGIIPDKNIETYTKIKDETGANGYELTGAVYVDTNSNLYYDNKDDVVGGVMVNLYDSETNEQLDSDITDIAGRYRFTNLEDKKYFVKFNYDNTEYVLSRDTSEEITKNKSNVINLENKYVTDNIEVKGKSISNIDLGLSRENVFDLELDMEVKKMTVQNSKESTELINENGKLSKVDIDPKLLNESRVLIEYQITVINQGSESGTARKIVNYMPKGMEFDSDLNPDWYIGADGNVYTRSLADTMLKPGETRKLRLVLVRNVTETNTGLLHNRCEIAEAISSTGILDIDSLPGNKLDEDDYSYADSIIGVATGLNESILPIVLTSIICIIPISIVVWKIIDKRRYV